MKRSIPRRFCNFYFRLVKGKLENMIPEAKKKKKKLPKFPSFISLLKEKNIFYLLFLYTIMAERFKSSQFLRELNMSFVGTSTLHPHNLHLGTCTGKDIFSTTAIWLTHVPFTVFLNGPFIICFLHHFTRELSWLPLDFSIGESGNLNVFKLTVKTWLGKNPLK